MDKEKATEETEDLKTKDDGTNDDTKDSGSDDGQSDKNKEEGEETITIPKAEHDQLVEERDNYRTGLLKRKSEEREVKRQASEGDGDDDGDGKEKEEALTETKVKEISAEAATTVLDQIQKSNEQRAQRQFLVDNPEYQDDANWKVLMTHFGGPRGKATTEDVLDDLEDAVILEKRASGKLDEYLANKQKKGKEESGSNISSAGGIGDSQKEGDTKGLTPEQEALARKMGNDPERIKNITEEDYTIDLMKPKKKEE